MYSRVTLQHCAVCCSALPFVAVRCSVLQFEVLLAKKPKRKGVLHYVECVVVRCGALQCVAVRCSAVQCIAD